MSNTAPPVFHYQDMIISMSAIDTEDDTFRLGLSSDLEVLHASIQAVGLINPPVLRQQNSTSYQIVCGFRRVMACKALGWPEVRSRVLKGSRGVLDCLKLAILDNRSHRQLNVVEQAIGIQKLTPHVPSRDRLQVLPSLLGFPKNEKVFSKLQALSQLPTPIQEGVIHEIVSLETSLDLSKFADDDALVLFGLFKELRMSQGKQRDVVALVQEIAMREGVEPKQVVQSKAVTAILHGPELNRNEKSAKIRAYLKRRRFPALARAEERFSKALKALKLDEHIHWTAPPYFEASLHTLRITFKSVREFNKRRKALDAMARNPALKRLLEPFDES